MGQRIREARKAKGVTQAELAKAVGITQQSIGKIENGGGATHATLVAIADALDTSTDLLLGRSAVYVRSGHLDPDLNDRLISLAEELAEEQRRRDANG